MRWRGALGSRGVLRIRCADKSAYRAAKTRKREHGGVSKASYARRVVRADNAATVGASANKGPPRAWELEPATLT